MTTANSSTTHPDGRTARRLANRNRILDAALALVADGVDFDADAVAANSGVSVRSVYNHFPTERDLIAGLYERGTELVRPLLAELPSPEMAFARRVSEWVRVWARMQEDIAPIRWRALVAEDDHPDLQPELTELRRAHLQEIKHRFPEIRNRHQQATAQMITDSLAWRSLRKHQRLSFEAACEVLEETLVRLAD